MQTIKDVPMVTADETEIQLNTVLYRGTWTSGYGFEKEGKADIEILRVISVNNSSRHFRTRCLKGCETEHRFSEGCSKDRLFGSITGARNYIREKMEYDISKADKAINKIMDTKKHIVAEMKSLKILGAGCRVPKAVK